MKNFSKIFIFAGIVLLSVSLSSAQDLPSLASDPSVMHGRLPDNVEYYIVGNSTDKGRADFSLVWRLGRPAQEGVSGMSPQAGTSVSAGEALRIARASLARTALFSSRSPDSFLKSNGVQGTSCGYIEMKDNALAFMFSDVDLNRGEPFLDSLLLLTFDLVKAYSDSVMKAGAVDCGQAIVISGDIDGNAVLSKMKMLSLFVPDIAPVEPVYDYKWYGRDSLQCFSVAVPSAATSTVIAEYSMPRVPREYMGTALPAVAAQMGQELGMILEKRLWKEFAASGVPVSGIDYRFSGSSLWSGDEKYTLSVSTGRSNVPDAVRLMSTVLSEISTSGVSVEEYAEARKNMGRKLEAQASAYVKSNRENIDRCISAYLYGTALVSPSEKLRFFEESGLADSSGAEFFNRFASSLTDSTGNMTLACVADTAEFTGGELRDMFLGSWKNGKSLVSSYAVKCSDTSAFDAVRTKCKIRRSRKDNMSGGSLWSFSNGMTVIYKNIPSGGRFRYSMVLKDGFSSVKDLVPGQGAFFSDMLGLYSVAGIGPDDFRYLLEANDIAMETEVGPVDMRISGSADAKSLDLLLKILLSLATESSVDSAAFDYYVECEKLRLKEGDGFNKRLVAIDRIMCPDFRFSSLKSPDALTPDLLEKAGEYFRRQFSKMNDGILVIAGDVGEQKLKKALTAYLGSFPVTDRILPRHIQPARTVSGGSTYIVDGSRTSLEVVMSAPVQMSAVNYMASEIASMVIGNAVTSAVSGMAATLRTTDAASSVPSERFSIALSVDACDTSFFAEGTERLKPVKALFAIRSILGRLSGTDIPQSELDACKTSLKNIIASRQNDPEYWIDSITGRYMYGKDFHTDYAGKIDAVTAGMVREIIYSLDNGAKVEYIVRPRKK